MKNLKFWLTLLAQVAIAATIFMALSFWQEREMLPSNSAVPNLTAKTLSALFSSPGAVKILVEANKYAKSTEVLQEIIVRFMTGIVTQTGTKEAQE